MGNRRIKITAGEVIVFARLNDSSTADAVFTALPVRASANTWGDEIYFSTQVRTSGDSEAREAVPLGTLGYWPPGNAICLFFGPTPASQGNEPRGASPITVIGMIEGDPNVLKNVHSGTEIRLEKT